MFDRPGESTTVRLGMSRRAHNPEVAGSNPAPATYVVTEIAQHGRGPSFTRGASSRFCRLYAEFVGRAGSLSDGLSGRCLDFAPTSSAASTSCRPHSPPEVWSHQGSAPPSGRGAARSLDDPPSPGRGRQADRNGPCGALRVAEFTAAAGAHLRWLGLAEPCRGVLLVVGRVSQLDAGRDRVHRSHFRRRTSKWRPASGVRPGRLPRGLPGAPAGARRLRRSAPATPSARRR